MRWLVDIGMPVSIHAPVKARHAERMLLAIALQVSIHAPVKARRASARNAGESWSFDPRACEGATFRGPRAVAAVEVSIHAPVKARHERGFWWSPSNQFRSTGQAVCPFSVVWNSTTSATPAMPKVASDKGNAVTVRTLQRF